MTLRLEQIFQELNQLTPRERWQVIEFLMSQFKSTVVGSSVPESLKSQEKPSAQTIFAATRGSWGDKSLEEIDQQLTQQRQQDWGE
jgi:hypothetical protein